MSENDLEARVAFLEKAMANAYGVIEQDRYEIQALKAALASLLDSLRPDDPAEAAEWFDAMLGVSIRNVGLHADLAADQIIGERGIDPDSIEALEDERKAVTEWLAGYFAGLKSPIGNFEGD